MMSVYKYILSGVIILTFHHAYAAGTFSISGRKILLDGAPFEVRGVCYQPAAIGEDPSAAPPFGDYYTSSYEARWTRDFDNLRLMGANVIRIYGWTIGADHSDFLDDAYNNGTQPLHLLINRYINPATDWSNTNAVNALVIDWEAIATELKDHPAVMGFLIGNEVNVQAGNSFDPQFWSAMNRVAGAVKTAAPDKLVSVAITDALDQVQSYDASMTNLDFWAIQVYRGSGFGSFFGDYAARSSKPLIITEFGYDAYDARIGAEFTNDAAYPADAMENLLNELSANYPVASGACIFEYADEWWKTGNPSTHDAPPGWSGPFVDGEANEEWWGVFRILDNGSAPDLLEPRAMFYRIAAMWNEPYNLTSIRGAISNGLPAFTLSAPGHLRDQQLQIDLSTNLADWITVADNSRSIDLVSFTPTILLTNTAAGQILQTTLAHDPAATGPYIPANLIANGDFDSGSTLGWTTFGMASSAAAQAGSYSLRLDAPGGFSIASAYQTVPASPGQDINFSGYMYTPSPLPSDTTFGLLKIVFEDLAGNDLIPASVSIGTPAAPANPGAESLPLLNSASPAGSWIFSEVQAIAPPGTASASFFMINIDQSANTMFFDTLKAGVVMELPETGNTAFFRFINSVR